MIRIGCVSFLNARPLIDRLDARPDIDLRFDVPSRLLADLEAGHVDLALCPVIDYQRSARPLAIVPVGGIGCDGPTLTVRLFSRSPLADVRRIAADTDSHTSVALASIVMRHQLQRDVAIDDFDARRMPDDPDARPEAMLLIGDKVVTAAPPPDAYPHTLDLGAAWKQLTDLPFVFAVWMARPQTELGDVPERLDDCRRANARRIDAIAREHAPPLGWPVDLARQYLGERLRYDVGPRQLQAMQLFWQRAARMGLTGPPRPLALHPSASPPAVEPPAPRAADTV